MKYIFLTLLALLIFFGYSFYRMFNIDPMVYERRLVAAEVTNDTEWATADVQIYEIAIWAKSGTKRQKIWSEIACTRKWLVTSRTMKNSATNSFQNFSLNEPEIWYPYDKDTAFTIKFNSDGLCDTLIRSSRPLPMTLRLFQSETGISQIIPEHLDCDLFQTVKSLSSPSVYFSKPQVRSVRTRPLKSFLTRKAYGPASKDNNTEISSFHPDLDAVNLDGLANSACK